MANRYWVGGTGTWTTTTTNWSASSGGSSGASAPTAADSVFFDQAGTYTVTMTGALACLDITVSAGTVTFTSTGTLAISGSMSLVTGTIWSATGTITFNATTAKTITTNAVTILASITLNGVGGTWQLQNAMTMGSTNTLTLTNGTLDLNGKTLTTGLFSSTNSNTRTIAFGAGNIICNAAGGTLWTTATVNNLTVTGTPVVNISNSGAVATTVSPGALTEANSISFNFTTGTYALTFLGTANHSAKNVSFAGFAGTWGATSTAIIYGNLTLSTGMTLTASASAMTFGATSGTKTITSNAKTIDFPITFNGVGGTWQLQDAITMGATRTLTLTNGTFDLNGKTLTTGSFSSSNTNTRTLAFGTGNITCIKAGGTLFDTGDVTGLTVTGTPIVNISYSGAVATDFSSGGGTLEAYAISFNVTAGSYALTAVGGVLNLTFSTAFTGTVSYSGNIYGNLTLSSAQPTLNPFNATFKSTSGTKTITSNNVSISGAVNFDGVGGTWQLQDNLTNLFALSLTNGTINLNGKTLTMGTAAFTIAAGTKNITFNGGTLVIPAAATTAFNNANPTGFTTTAGTGTGKISMTGATAKTFVGGGSTYNCTLSNDGAGTLTISGNNTIDTLTRTAGAMSITGSNTITTLTTAATPVTFTITAGTTQTITNWSLNGTAGNLVTIISRTAGVPALLSKASGTVSADYLSLKDSTALGGATWYAGANSTNVSGNLGWIFTAPPGNFFFMF